MMFLLELIKCLMVAFVIAIGALVILVVSVVWQVGYLCSRIDAYVENLLKRVLEF